MIDSHSYPYIIVPLILGSLTLYLFHTWRYWIYIALFFFLLSFFFLIFFRDPQRNIQKGIVSPADGTIIDLQALNDCDIGPAQKISIFMNLWNVHINRFPLEGTIIKMKHQPGGHRPAFTQNSCHNEQLSYLLNTPRGKIKIIQIAGTFARRITPYVKIGQRVKKGDKMGIVRFGSRVDLYIPLKISLGVKVGEQVLAGDTLEPHSIILSSNPGGN
jgi:phosphatidylserine decarboxylase